MTRTNGIVRGLLLGLLVALPTFGCAQNSATGRRQLIVVSRAQVNAMGEEAKPTMVAEFGGEVPSAPLRTYVDGVGRKLLEQVEPEYADLAWEFIVLDSPVINAFALPGGKIFITRGILSRFENEAEVAGVLGHEIGHVTARHVDERISQSLISQFSLAVVGAFSQDQLIAEGASLAAQGALLHFSRAQELESDALGMRYMAAAGYDPEGMREVIGVLLDAMGDERPPEILSTHPDPDRRAEQADELLATTYAETRDNPAYGKYRARFQREAAPALR